MEIDGLEIKIVQKNIKNLYIRVYPLNGEIRLVCPRQLDNDTIRQLIMAKIDWIRKKRAKFLAQPRKIDYQYISGEKHYFKGDRLILKVIYHQTSPKVILEGSQLSLYVRFGSICEQREQVLLAWYRQELKAQLPQIIAKWEQVIGVKVNDWRIKKMKTRWGTCNVQARRIWLNLELIKQPSHCLEYVVVHELVHLLERKHNARFWQYMTQFMPDWQQYQTELNRLPLV
ncbi:MAG: SprT family zinc-dependent metalloprotease [Cyanobacteria bacterium P01_A01_bin.40]